MIVLRQPQRQPKPPSSGHQGQEKRAQAMKRRLRTLEQLKEIAVLSGAGDIQVIPSVGIPVSDLPVLKKLEPFEDQANQVHFFLHLALPSSGRPYTSLARSAFYLSTMNIDMSLPLPLFTTRCRSCSLHGYIAKARNGIELCDT